MKLKSPDFWIHPSLRDKRVKGTLHIIIAVIFVTQNVKKMKLKLLLLALALTMLACSGNDKHDEVICTEEFRIVGVTVTGVELTDFYTLRASSNDSIRFNENPAYPMGSWYPVLDDSYQPILEGTQEDFYFIGTIGDSTVFEIHFIIGADQCHISKVLGPEKIEI